MATGFYNRCAYPFIDQPVPSCFIELDALFDARDQVSSPWLPLAENLCRRSGDVDLYARLLSTAINDPNPFKAAALCGSFVVGYFGACKSLLDAIAITLNAVHNLQLASRDQDVGKNYFWKTFRSRNQDACTRYEVFRSTYVEVVRWRDSAIHRVTPFVVPRSAGPPNEVPRDQVEIRMVGAPDRDLQDIAARRLSDADFVDPLDLHRAWRQDFEKLCTQICTDLRSRISR